MVVIGGRLPGVHDVDQHEQTSADIPQLGHHGAQRRLIRKSFSSRPDGCSTVEDQFSDTYISVCAKSQACVSCLSLPSSSAIGRQITDVVTSGGQNSTKFVLRTIGVCSRRGTFAVPVTLTVS